MLVRFFLYFFSFFFCFFLIFWKVFFEEGKEKNFFVFSAFFFEERIEKILIIFLVRSGKKEKWISQERKRFLAHPDKKKNLFKVLAVIVFLKALLFSG